MIAYIENIITKITGKESHETKLISGSAISFAISIIIIILSFIKTKILASTLGEDGIGVVNIALSYGMLLVIPSVLGMGPLVVRNVAKYRVKSEWGLLKGLIRWTGRLSFASSIVVALIFYLFLFCFSSRLNLEKQMLEALYIIPLMLPFYVLIGLKQGALRGLDHIPLGKTLEAVSPFLFLVFISGLFFVCKNCITPQAVLIISVAGMAGSLIVTYFCLVKFAPPETHNIAPTYNSKIWIRSMIPLVFFATVQVIYKRTDTVMLGALMDCSAAGIYGVASQCSTLILFFLTTVNIVLAPKVASLYARGDMKQLQKIVTLSARIILLLTLVPAIGMIIFREQVIEIISTSSFLLAKPALVILVVSQLINVATGPVSLLLTMTGREKALAFTVGLSALLNVVLNFWFIRKWGVEGAAIATGTSIIIRNIFQFGIIVKKIGINPTAINRGKLL